MTATARKYQAEYNDYLERVSDAAITTIAPYKPLPYGLWRMRVIDTPKGGGQLPYQLIKNRCDSVLTGKPPLVYPCFEKTVFMGKTYGLSEAGYDIRIKQDLTLYPTNLQNMIHNFLYDNRKHWFWRWFNKATPRPSYALASTIECFDVPDDIMPKIIDKSSWAREGLAVQNTVGEPGWRGYLTLELTNHGPNVIEIKAGMPIAQMIFEQLIVPTTLTYTGKYQNQADKPVESVYEQIGIKSGPDSKIVIVERYIPTSPSRPKPAPAAKR